MTRRSCGWNVQDAPATILESLLGDQGWSWRWEGDDLLHEVPGWIPPAMVIVMFKPGLFDEDLT